MRAQKLNISVGIMLVSLAAAFGQTPPPNDNFASATVLTGSLVTFSGTLVGATYEPAEASYLDRLNDGGSGGGSIWWTWTAPQSSTVVIEPARDYSGVALEIFQGTNLNALTHVGGSSLQPPFGRFAQFSATAGVTYQIQVAGSWTSSLSFKLTATKSPVFLIQPQSCVVSPYGSAFFSAFANVPRPWINTYQWTFNGVPIPNPHAFPSNQTYPYLLIHGVTTNNAGTYSVIASNAAGTTESATVTLTVTDTNPVPQIAALRPNNSTQLPFTLKAEPGRWYEIEVSQDLQNWNPSWIQATNPSSLLSVSRLGPNHFVRASLNVPSDVCVAQLKQMRAACAIYAIFNKWSPSATYVFTDLMPYVPLTEWGSLPPCPEGGEYWAGATITNPPSCSLSGHGHYLVDP
jgi:hypothetical protein